MLLIWISWIQLAILGFIIGFCANQFLSQNWFSSGKPDRTKMSVDYLILTGFLIISGLCALLSLFIPVNLWLLIPFWILSVILAWSFKDDLKVRIGVIRRNWREAPSFIKWSFALLFLLISWYTASQAYHHTDLELYHAQSVEWIRRYSVIPGLGNLHGRFAYNSHYFISSALFTIPLGPHRILYPVFSFFFLILSFRLLINMNQAVSKKNMLFFVLSALLLVLISMQFPHRLKCLSSDDITCILIIYTSFIFLKEGISFQNRGMLSLFALIVFTTITYKLSSLFLATILPFALWRSKPRQIAFLFGMGLVIGLPFLIRNFYLSGYLIYPFHSLDIFDVDWKIPMDWVLFEEDLVKGWARLPAPPVPEATAGDILDVPFWEWLKEFWAVRLSFRWKAMYIINLFAVPLLGLALFKKQFKLAILFGVMLINLFFWFYQAPDPRFAYGFLFFNFSLVLAYLVQITNLGRVVQLRRGMTWAIAVLALVLMIKNIYSSDPVFAKNINLSILALPPNHAEQVESVEEFQARNFTLYYPSDVLCFTNSIPCTPYPRRNLEMRGETFQEGFRIHE